MRRARAAATFAATVVTWLAVVATTLAASPSPPAAGGDPRSPGQGPGLVGDPVTALLAVVALGVLTVIATLVYVRLTASRGA